MSSEQIKELRERLARALDANQLKRALTITSQLEAADIDHAAKWAQRRGDLYRRLGRLDLAGAAFEKSVRAYQRQGLHEYAAAMERTRRSTWPPPV